MSFAVSAMAQTLNLPFRLANTPTGSQFATNINSMSQTTRENWVLAQVQLGNVPGWYRNLVPISYTHLDANSVSHSVTYYVAPDYLAIGSDTDYFLEPTSPILAQRIANFLNCSLPTRMMVDYIWTNSAVKLSPYAITPTNNNNATVAVFVLQDNAVMAQRNAVTNAHPLGALVSGDKKDEIISNYIYNNLSNGVTNPVVIYGWMYTSGVPIQQLYNGHSELYMDYSHGIRMVQMQMLLDGTNTTVSNVLSDPILYPLLSDEGQIIKPCYTIDNTIPPFFVYSPASQTVKQGANATFTSSAFGDGVLRYQWRLNGANISGATNATFFVTNAQNANVGSYSLVVTSTYGSVTSIPTAFKVTTNAFPQLFSDTLGADTSSNWNFYAGSDNNVLDYSTNWAFNYGGVTYTWNGTYYSIPPAPNTLDGSTKAVKFTVNDSNGVNAAVNIYPKGKSFSGNFALKFDMWLNYPGNAGGATGVGTTEYAICGIDHTGTRINWFTTNATPSDGLWFTVDGEGGSSRDYRAYSGNLTGTNNDLIGAASGLVGTIHTNSIFQTLFPATRFETAGVPGKNWVAGEIDQTNGTLIWKLDGTVIASRVNTSGFNNGNIMLGYMDIFPSIASPLSDAYLLFANVRVEDWSSAPVVPANITGQPQSQTVPAGTNVTFTVVAASTGPTAYQWMFNGTNIFAATNTSLSLMAINTNNSGGYSVVISNLAGSVISSLAQLSVTPTPLNFTGLSLAGGNQLQLSFTAPVGNQYLLQSSADLVLWTNVASIQISTNPTIFLDTNTSSDNEKFYRLKLQ